MEPGSAAAKAGLRAATGTTTVSGQSYPTGSDVITAFGGTRVATAQQLRSLIDGVRPGQSIALTVVRGGKTRSVSVVLGSRS